MSGGFDNSAFLTGNNAIDSLLLGLSWSGTVNRAAQVTYTYNSINVNADFKANFDAATQAWSNAANITFRYLQPTTANIAAANILGFQDNTLQAQGILGLTEPTYSGNQYIAADISIASNITGANLYPGGVEGFLTILHELGHALGFKHAGFYGGGGEIAPVLPADQDNTDATVMSYHAGPNTPDSNQPTTPMIYDILAMQYLYGANHNYHAGNDTYNFDGSKNAMTIWDGNGNDSIVSSSYGGNVTIDLREGLQYVSHIGQANVWNAFGANIENAFTGAGSDFIRGNDLANFVNSGQGNDTIQGAAGNDIMAGGQNNDLINGGQGDDIVNGNKGDDTVTGDLSNDLINGGQDNDSIMGGDGNDFLSGDRGNDTLDGGAGADTFLFVTETGNDVIVSFDNPGAVAGDIIEIARQIYASAQDAAAHVAYTGSDAILALDAGSSITIHNLTGLLTSQDFFIV